MENPARASTLNDLKEKVIFWAMQVRLAEKAVCGAPDGTVSAAKRRLQNARREFNHATDIYMGKKS